MLCPGAVPILERNQPNTISTNNTLYTHFSPPPPSFAPLTTVPQKSLKHDQNNSPSLPSRWSIHISYQWREGAIALSWNKDIKLK